VSVDENKHFLEDFPRGPLYSKITRHQFFSSIKEEAKNFAYQDLGATTMKLSDLGVLLDEDMLEIIPKIKPDYEIFIQQYHIIAKKDSSDPISIIALDPIVGFAFNLFNGMNSIQRISQEVATFSALPPERAFLLSRGLFLTLVRNGICIPLNNPLLG